MREKLVEEKAREAAGVVANHAVLFEQFVHDAFQAEALNRLDVVFHGLRALFFVALDDGAAGNPAV